MRRIALLLFLPCFLACGQGLQRGRFVPPDGNWWLAASAAQRDGFYVGYMNCGIRAAKLFPIGISGSQIQDAVTRYYQKNSGSNSRPVASTIAAIETLWRHTGAYHFERADPKDEWDGQFWWSNVDERAGIVRGFLACQAAVGQPLSGAPVKVLVAWIDHWYGVDPAGRDSDMQGPRMDHKLGTAILAAEKANP